MYARMNIVVQGQVAYRSIYNVLSITSQSSNTVHWLIFSHDIIICPLVDLQSKHHHLFAVQTFALLELTLSIP